MGKPYQVKDENGNASNWFFFSEKAGDVIDAGPDESIAISLSAAENEGATIATALEGKEDAIKETTVSDRKETKDSNDGLQGGTKSPSTDIATSDNAKKRPALSPQFLAKIKEKAASGSATIGIELERYLIARFGFDTEDLDEDDPDVELLKLGWELQWGYWLAGKEPPAWTLIAFGQICCTVRLLASAERKPPKEKPELGVVTDVKKES
jgi:hypothetical protein